MLTVASGFALGRDDLLPFAQVRRRRLEPSLSQTIVVEVLLVQQDRDLVDVVGVDRRDDGALLDVGEERDLAALLLRQRVAGSGTGGRRAGCRCRAAP